jgi:outer membrane protein OmpA-like peptidoglycan-associated protein
MSFDKMLILPTFPGRFGRCPPIMFSFRVRILPLLLAHLAWQAVPAQAQVAVDTSVGAAIPLAFAGDNGHIGVGYDTRHKLSGELLWTLSDDARSAWLAEGWVGRDAGGLQLDYHWLVDGDARVGKLFAAWDRNASNDEKLSIGGGAESEAWFWGLYGSAALTGRRDLGTRTSAVTDTRTGTDASLGDFLQDFTTTTTVRTFERPYDYGVGARVGRYYDQALIRVVAGLDHEIGRSSSSQTTASIGLEKFFYGSPHSILVTAAAATRRGEFESDRRDHRVGIYWRYQFGGKGGGWQPTKAYRRVEEVRPTPALAPSVSEAAPSARDKKVVKIVESVSAETFFELNRATLLPSAAKQLDELVARLRNSVVDGSLRITGHTCDLGPAAYNQALSEQRAAAVRNYIAGSGALSADRVVAVGKGEDDPKYPNTQVDRAKNRRCDIEFGIVTERLEEVPAAAKALAEPIAAVPAPVWRLEEVAVEPAWRRRALHNPIAHKREVDTYREQERSLSVTVGERQYLNRPPVARDDYAERFGSLMPVTIAVLANDTDPDGDPLTVIATTNGRNGTVTILGNGVLRYTWLTEKPGLDSFTYTISDGHGSTATARVNLLVIDP